MYAFGVKPKLYNIGSQKSEKTCFHVYYDQIGIQIVVLSQFLYYLNKLGNTFSPALWNPPIVISWLE
jgi:hypothetical protein